MQDDNQDISNVPSKSPDFRTELAKRLNELVPEAIADGRVDVGKLKELLDGDVSDSAERFGLFWPGKKRAMYAAQETTTATLRPAPDESKDWSTTKNIFIEGDNLEALKVMQRQYHNKIKMIYIDPPYNTGKDFVYPDNFKEGLQNYLEFSKQVDEGGKRVSTNSDTEGRYHSNWLNMMYPRLKLARNLLTDDGIMFVSIDDHEQDNLKKLCNEIFGEDRFIAQFIWKSRVSEDTRALSGASTDHEYILCYSRAGVTRLAGVEKDAAKFSNPDSDPRGDWRSADMTGLATKDQRPNLHYDLINPDTNINYGCPPKGWRFDQKSMARRIVENRILWPSAPSGRPRLKLFESDIENKFKNISTIFTDITTRDGTKAVNDLLGIGVFDFPKPTNLIKRLIEQVCTREDLILDFFSGSGTTAQAVMELNAQDGGNRKHIQIQLPEPTDVKSEAYRAGYKTIAQIARARINRAGEKIKIDLADKLAERQEPLDTGYRTFKLADTNFTKWQSDHTGDVNEFQQRLLDMRESANDDASEIDILTEVLLKLGLELTVDSVQKDIAGLNMWSISNGNILAYIKERQKPTLDQLRAAADTHPVKIVVLDDAFKGDDELKTNLTQICKTNHVELWTV